VIPASLIVPIRNEAPYLDLFVAKLLSLNSLPNEVIFIDTGSSDKSVDIINNIKINFRNSGVKFQLLKLNNAYPGKARNLGIRKSNNSWVCFLDVGVYPDKNWLSDLWNDVNLQNSSIVFGRCKFNSEHNLGKIVCALSYGVNKIHNILPASIVHKDVFEDSCYFNESIRSAEDIVWRNCLYKNKINYYDSTKATVIYSNFPDTIFKIINKWFIYAKFEAATSVTSLLKMATFIFFFIIILISIFSFPFGFFLFILYFFFRGYYDPFRRSGYKKWWSNWAQFFFTPFIAFIMDISSMLGFIYGKLSR
jgi:glycosyltransferase involved in cell wall biosynthesis